MVSDALWPPNGCERCGALERGHTESHDYSPPADALRLARMKARRDARHAAPLRNTPPDTVVTLEVRTDDWEDALRYAADSARAASLATEALAGRMRGFAAEFASTSRVLAIGTPGTGAEGIYRTRRCRCSVVPVVETLRDPTGEDIAEHFSRLRTSADFLVDGGDAAADPELEAAKNWLASGSTCAHVCGPDPGHTCDARATTTLRHPLPSGGMRDLPLCGPCAGAERGAGPPAGMRPLAEAVAAVIDYRWRLEGEWVNDTVGAFAPFAEAVHRPRTDLGMTREEAGQAAAGILALAQAPGNPGAEVPLRLGFGGPVIGGASVSADGTVTATVTDPSVAAALRPTGMSLSFGSAPRRSASGEVAS